MAKVNSNMGMGVDDNAAYINSLEQKYKQAERAELQANSNAQRILNVRDELRSRRENLELDLSKMTETNELAKDVINTLESNKVLVERAGIYADLTNDAVVNFMKIAENSLKETEQLFKAIESAKFDVSNGQQSASADGAIMKILNDLGVMLKDAVKLAYEVLTATLNTYQKTEVLKSTMGDSNGQSGLTKAFYDLDQIINVVHDSRSSIKFPREMASGNLMDTIKQELEQLETELNNLQDAHNHYLQAKNLAIANKNAIKKSLEAAKKAAEC